MNPLSLRVVLLVLLWSWAGQAKKELQTITGKVVGISDGDTITVLDGTKTQYKIRLIGIDSPEKKQAFGTVARDHLSAQVFQKDVIVEYRKRDRYGRILGKIRIDGRDINLEQIKAGLAWHYKHFAKDQEKSDRDLYSAAENEARAQKAGLWRDPTQVAPWDFRRKRKEPPSVARP